MLADMLSSRGMLHAAEGVCLGVENAVPMMFLLTLLTLQKGGLCGVQKVHIAAHEVMLHAGGGRCQHSSCLAPAQGQVFQGQDKGI